MLSAAQLPLFAIFHSEIRCASLRKLTHRLILVDVVTYVNPLLGFSERIEEIEMRNFSMLLLLMCLFGASGCGDASSTTPTVPDNTVNTQEYEDMMNKSAQDSE